VHFPSTVALSAMLWEREELGRHLRQTASDGALPEGDRQPLSATPSGSQL
jgi:hypothetical protein